MKHRVTRVRNLLLALKELQPFILNGRHLQTGRGFTSLNDMRSREALSNFLICAALDSISFHRRTIFTSAPDAVGGDGLIHDTVTEVSFPTEHVMVPAIPQTIGRDGGELVLEAIKLKVEKGGAAYATGKTLVVFLFAGVGEWWPNKVARQLPSPLLFESVWVTGLHGVQRGRYVYDVTRLDTNSPAFRIRFTPGFDGWEVEGVQGTPWLGFLAARFRCPYPAKAAPGVSFSMSNLGRA